MLGVLDSVNEEKNNVRWYSKLRSWADIEPVLATELPRETVVDRGVGRKKTSVPQSLRHLGCLLV